ncbi:MAG: FAD-binding oxidoreductase [archaeon]|nr:FAD-binding oxidoreductase [archaeon]
MPNDYDIVIVGAGILGLSSAYHLKKNNQGKSILVIDRFGDVAQGNTARSNAMFRNTFTSRDNLILSDTSIDFYLDTQKSGVDLGLKKSGYLWIMSEKQLSSSERYIQKMLDNKIELRTYDRQELKRLLPTLKTMFGESDESRLLKIPDIAGAAFGVKCGRLDPEKLSRFYSDGFRALGGKIAFNSNVRSLIAGVKEPLGIEGEPFVWQEGRVTGVSVEGELQGEIRADTVVIAAGVWNNELLDPIGIDGHVKAKKRQLFTVSAKQNPSLQALIHTTGFNNIDVLPFVILPKSGCYVKALEENNEFWLGCEDEFNRPYLNIPEKTLDNCKAEPSYYEQSLYPILRSYFPEFENAKPAQMWAGYYSMNTVDSMPFVFEENGMIIAGGGSGSGIMKGDAMGRIVDAVYREGDHAVTTLYGGRSYEADRMSFKNRSVEREEWVI